jgi:hypothetical protein
MTKNLSFKATDFHWQEIGRWKLARKWEFCNIEISSNTVQLSSGSPLMSKTPTMPDILNGKELLGITFRAMISKKEVVS